MKAIVKVIEKKDRYKVYYYTAKNEEEYNLGNIDLLYTHSINKDLVENEEDLMEQIKLKDDYYEDVVIVERKKEN